jgi:hypothetical protein
MRKKSHRLALEQLETRDLPATFGIAWPGADHLKVSFALDGTLVDGAPSVLFQNLNTQAATKVWQTEVLRALQSWAVNANINLGVVADGGQAIGADGPIQGNPNFGDIRLASRPLGSDVLALGTPYDVTAGTRAGDVVFNSGYTFGVGQGPYDLFSVALHEVGHSFGLADNTDPTSVMYQYYNGTRTGPSAADVALLQALYGARKADMYEAGGGNNTFAAATTLKVPEVAADVGTGGDVDYYKYKVPDYANKTMTIKVQTAGLSLLTPRLTVLNAAGQVITTASSTDPLSNDVTINLTNVKRGTVLYFKVEGARTDAFGVGGYRLKIDSGAVSQAQIKAIDSALNGNTVSFITDDRHTNDTVATATDLNQAIYQLDQRFDYSINAGISDATDLDYYKIVAPAATASGPQTMVVTVTRTGTCTFDPQLTVFDGQGNQVDAEILVNDDGSYAVQVVGATPGATYRVLVSTDDFDTTATNMTGSYLLGINFQDNPIVLETYVDDTLSASNQVDVFTFQATASAAVELVLSASTGTLGASVQTAVRMNIYDSLGVLVASMDAQDGDTVSKSLYLGQGNYTVRFVAATKDGSPLPQVWYTLQGRTLTDQQDPLPIDPTLDPTQLPPPPDPIVVTITPPPLLPPIDPSSNPWTPPPVLGHG